MVGRTAVVAAAALLFQASGAWAASGAPPSVRRVVGTGDTIPGLGRVGTFGVALVDLDAAGRALLLRGGTGRTPGLYWADEGGIASAFDPAALDGLRMMEWGLGWNQRGDLALLATAPGPSWSWFGAALFVVDAAGLRRVLSVGERDADGNPICRLIQARINAAGRLAVLAHIATGGRSCGVRDTAGDSLDEQAVYLVGNGLQRLTTSRELTPDAPLEVNIELLALSDDGAAIVAIGFSKSRVLRIVRIAADGVTDVVGPSVRGPDSARLDPVVVVATSPSGEVLFRGGSGRRLGLYRTARRTIVRVFAQGDSPPPELSGRLDAGDHWGALNDAGDVLIEQATRPALFPADGSPPRVLPGFTQGGALNASGDVALTETIGDHVTAVVRWRDGTATLLARTGDPLPGGEWLADSGADGRCAAPDGRLGLGVSGVDDSAGLACVDTAGPRLVVRVGDPAPGGRRFYAFHQCAFAGTSSLVFTASILEPDPEQTNERYTSYRVVPSIYRATPERVERVIGRGDVTTDGAVVVDLLGGTGAYPLVVDADARGRVLALATLDDRYGPTALLLRDVDGSLRRLPIPLWAYGSWAGVGFPTPSVIDHRFLSGETDAPAPLPFTGASVASAAGAALAPAAAGAEPTYGFGEARLFGDGVLLIASEREYPPYDYVSPCDYVDVPIAFAWTAAGLRRVLDPREALPDAYRTDFDILRVAGDLAAFRADGHVFTYTLGDAVARELPRPPADVDPWGSVGFSFAGLWADGRALFDLYDRGSAIIAAWDGAATELLLTLAYNQGLGAVTPDAIFFQDDTVRALAPPVAAGAQCPLPPTLVMPTRTITPTPTPTSPPTATWPPTATRTARPTRTASATVTATPRCTADGACLQVGRADAAPGNHVVVGVALTGGSEVVATQNTLRLPGVAALETCRAGAASGKQARVRVEGDTARVLVLALDEVTPIGDQAELYQCTLRVAPDAPTGHYPIACASAGASDAGGGAIPIGCRDGELVVADPQPASPTAPHGAAGDAGAELSRAEDSGGCAIGPTATPSGGALLIWAALLACARRRRSRGR